MIPFHNAMNRLSRFCVAHEGNSSRGRRTKRTVPNKSSRGKVWPELPWLRAALRMRRECRDCEPTSFFSLNMAPPSSRTSRSSSCTNDNLPEAQAKSHVVSLCSCLVTAIGLVIFLLEPAWLNTIPYVWRMNGGNPRVGHRDDWR